MSSEQQCQDNYSNLIASVMATGLLVISELLPFIDSLKGNGVVHGVISSLRAQFPIRDAGSSNV